MDCITPGSSVLCGLENLLKFTSVESVMLSNHLILWCPSHFAFNLSQHQGLFQSVGSLLQVVSFSISPSKEYSGLVFFRIDWFDLLAVQVTLKSLLQHHNVKAAILQPPVFFMVQLYIHRWLMGKKPIALTFSDLPAEHCGDFWKGFLGWSAHMASISMPDLLPQILWASGMLIFLACPGLLCLKHK